MIQTAGMGKTVDSAVDYQPVVERRGRMKSFYTPITESPLGRGRLPGAAHGATSSIASRARVAVYEAPGAAPRVVDVEPAPVDAYIESLAATVHRLASDLGGDVPYSVIREVSENFIHADFAEPVVSILDAGRTIRFADRGPGITDKDHAVLPGFTTATGAMKEFIRGVGSGLPLVKDFLGLSGGALQIEDNLGCGAVVTVSTGVRETLRSAQAFRPEEVRPARPAAGPVHQFAHLPFAEPSDTQTAPPLLTTRQKQVLALVMESGSAGPSLVSKELGVGISTAYRDLASLEEHGLIEADGGKRALTDQGLSYLDGLTSGS